MSLIKFACKLRAVVSVAIALALVMLPLTTYADSSLAHYRFDRTLIILDSYPKGFHVYAYPAGKVVAESEVETHLVTLYKRLLKYHAVLLNTKTQASSTKKPLYQLILVNPEQTITLLMGDSWLKAGGYSAPISESDFLAIRAILDERDRVNQKNPLDLLDEVINATQKRFKEGGLALPFSKGAEVKKVVRTDETENNGTQQAVPHSSQLQKTQVKIEQPKVMVVTPVGNNQIDADTIKVDANKSDLKASPILIDGNGPAAKSKPLKPKKENKDFKLSEDVLQILYTLLGLAAVIALFFGLNSYVNKKQR